MIYSAKAIANLLIDVAYSNGDRLDQMKLQKLTYIMHGWNLAITGHPLISDDVQAWQYGPVIPALYHEFKNSGRQEITDYATDFHVNKDDFSYSFTTPKIGVNDPIVRKIADKIWKIYGALTGPQLSNLTHMPHTPWDQVYKQSHRGVISNELIRSHFIGVAQSRNG